MNINTVVRVPDIVGEAGLRVMANIRLVTVQLITHGMAVLVYKHILTATPVRVDHIRQVHIAVMEHQVPLQKYAVVGQLRELVTIVTPVILHQAVENLTRQIMIIVVRNGLVKQYMVFIIRMKMHALKAVLIWYAENVLAKLPEEHLWTDIVQLGAVCVWVIQ